MKTIEETRRELFRDLWIARTGYEPALLPSGSYYELGPNLAWQGFNAALDAVCIELPKSCAFESLDSSGVFVQLTYEIGNDSKDPVELVRLSDCRAAIESTNLGIKIK